jgi:hypothetical protein
MTKGERHGNREAKKPKKEKPKVSLPASRFAPQLDKANAAAKTMGGRK